MGIIELIAGPAVVAAIISGVISFFGAKKDRDLKYITGERKKWRTEIRKIIESLSGADWEETVKILASLKVRINALGITDKSYFKDAHIWELIFKIEEEKVEGKTLLLYQRQLTEYISILLKMDWERAKAEVKGNVIRIFQWICLSFSSIGMGIVVGCAAWSQNEKSVNDIELPIFTVGLLASLGIIMISIPLFSLMNSMSVPLLTLTTKVSKKKYGVLNFWIPCTVGFGAFCGTIWGCVWFIKELKKILKETSAEGSLVILIVCIVGWLLHLIELLSVWAKIYDYNWAIVEIKERYEKFTSPKSESYVVSLKEACEESEEIRLICRVMKKVEAEE